MGSSWVPRHCVDGGLVVDVDLPGTAAEGPPEVLGTLEPSLEFKVPCQKPVLLDVPLEYGALY